MKRITRYAAGCVLAALIASLAIQDSALAAEVAVVSATDSPPVERIATQDLITILGRLYPKDRFVSGTDLPESGKAIVVGSMTNAVVRGLVKVGGPSASESFEVRRVNRARGELGLIVGADPRGTAHGVYALLKELGCGFFLSGDTLPAPSTNAFSFEGWALTNAPLVRDRLVFDWHNFLSGCSTWDLKDWQSWTRQSQKMGFNAIMVHAYGNNPMAGFTFNGKQKPLGFLSTTVKGRDWSTMHVNDVRRLWGGEVFSTPAFGSEAGLAPDDQRGEAAQRLMRSVFDYAEQRAMDVYFALDVDTVSANPQELILTLPEAARFSINALPDASMNQSNGKMWLANPDTREGFQFYHAQVDALLKAYPNLDCLAVWFRNQATPWMGFKVSEMPTRWQEEYRAEIAKTSNVAKSWRAHNIFALGKIVSAFERALRDAGRSDVQLALGTWRFNFLPAADRFLPRHIKLIGLDYDVLTDRSELRDAESRRVLREVGAHRPVIPVVWAQHDDGHYAGRPYTPFADLHSRLADANAAGFGIIHWTTRPLDLFFTSLIDQVWHAGRDKPLRATCDDAAERLFGRTARAPMGEYLERWLTGAPQFGRETSDFFIDRPLKDVEGIIAGCRERLKLIGQVQTNGLTKEQRDRVAYFEGLEKFIVAFHEAQAAFARSQVLLNAGDLPGARAAIRSCEPERVIEQFARFSSLGGMTRGEQGLVVTLNTRWLTHIIRHRQALGLEAVRVNFAPTQHDPLAQSAGKFTFHFSPDRKVWECWGTQETGAEVFTVPADVNITTQDNTPASWDEIARSGIERDKPITFALRPIMARDSRNTVKALKLPAGDYQLRLLFLDPSSTAPGQRVFDVSLKVGSASRAADRLDIFQRAGAANRLIERSYPVRLEQPGAVEVTLTPVKGKALIAGAVLEPTPRRAEARPERSVGAPADSEAFSEADIKALLRKVNAWQLAHPWKPADRNWIRATYYTGVMAAYAATGDDAYLKQALTWAEENQWQPGNERAGGNILTCAQTYLELFSLKTNRAFIEPTIQWLDSGESNTPTGAKVWYLEGGLRYADSLYVGTPSLAMLAEATGNRKYLDWMNAFFWDVHGEIFDQEAGLFYRDKRFAGKTSANGRKVIWSRGNGWAFASLPRILQHLPKDDPNRPKYEALFKQMAASLAKRQQPDGLWRPNLDDPEEYSMPETSGTGFFCYGLAWGVRNDLLDRETYLPVIRRGWSGLVRCVSPEGKVQWGQLVGDRPVNVKQEDSHEYMTGTFLLAGSEMIHLGKALALSSSNDAKTNTSLALPHFRYHGVVLSADGLKYRPHDDVIYPTVVRMDWHVSSPLGKYYMYYAPHDVPGGICLAYADMPEGPWREYANNPIISRDWSPHYQVSHVSGPDAIWNEQERKVFLYFHGENNVTRLASSADGIHFAYEAAVITAGMFEPQVTEASYGRVFEYALPDKDNRYVMLLMGNKQNVRRICLAWSKDGRKWETRRTPFMDPPPGTDQVAGAIYFPWRGHHYIIAHANDSKIKFNEGYDLYLAETDAGFRQATQLGKFMSPTFVSPTNPAVMSPTIFEEAGRLYMFFNIGARQNNKIALAIAEPGFSQADNVKPLVNTGINICDLSRIRREASAYAEALLIPGKPYGSYRHPRDTNSTLYAACDVAIMRAIMGEDLQRTLTSAQCAEWINQINSFARADGTYGPALGTHSPEHANGMVIGALGALGGKQKYPVRLFDAFDSVDEIEPWLEKMNWRNQWSGSHLFWGGLQCFSLSRHCTPEWREKVFAWLDRNVDPQTGWWRVGVEQGKPGVDGLGGGAHIWPIYQHHGHRFPQPERVIDSILAMQKPDGSWLEYGGYLELDALYGLTYMSSLAPDYRRDDILRAARRHGQGLVERWSGFLERKPNLHLLLAATGSFGLLNQLLPAEYPDAVRWTDIFSDSQLYRTRSVEVLE